MGKAGAKQKTSRARARVVKRKPVLSKFAKAAKLTKSAASARAPARPSAAARKLKCVVINLKDRDDRWQSIQRSARKNAPWLKMQRLDAVNGKQNPPSENDVTKNYSTLRMAKLFHWYRARTVPMSGGERGCCASHLKAWRKCAAGKEPLVVLEDDAVILPDFTATLSKALAEAPKDIGALWLSSKDRMSRRHAGQVLRAPGFVWTTVGYVIWPKAARALIKLLPMDLPVDNFMGWHIKEQAVLGFSVQPACVRQAKTWNLDSDVPHSDDVALWNHPSNKDKPQLC
jgi:glycosyl transferase family 25